LKKKIIEPETCLLPKSNPLQSVLSPSKYEFVYYQDGISVNQKIAHTKAVGIQARGKKDSFLKPHGIS